MHVAHAVVCVSSYHEGVAVRCVELLHKALQVFNNSESFCYPLRALLLQVCIPRLALRQRREVLEHTPERARRKGRGSNGRVREGLSHSG